MTRDFYVYAHCLPDGTPFYIGKGVSKRRRDFCRRSEAHKRIVSQWGRDNIIVESMLCKSEAEAFYREICVIAALRHQGKPLVNICAGGQGAAGAKRTDAAKLALSTARKGRALSEEHKRRLSQAKVGVKQSIETIEKRATKLRGKKRTGETKRMMSQAATGRVVSEATREKLRALKTGLKQSPSTIEKRVMHIRGVARPPHVIEAVRKAQLERWAKTKKEQE